MKGVLLCLSFLLHGLITAVNLKSDTLNPASKDTTETKLIGGRYVFMQSGYPVEKRTLQYQNLNGLMNDFQYGISNEISIAAGIVLPSFAYIAPQYSTQVAKDQRLVIGDVYGTSLLHMEDNEFDANMLYAGYTYGGIHNHFTVALGYLTSNKTPSGNIVFQLGGQKKLSRSIYLLGEMWYSNGYQYSPSTSKWRRDANGQPLLEDPSRPLSSPYVLDFKRYELNRNTLYANVQFRLISEKNSNKSWSLGLLYYANWGGNYIEEGKYGETRKLSNLFVLPLPSISFIQRIGDFRPQEISLKNSSLPLRSDRKPSKL
jgi:hypothetical protein